MQNGVINIYVLNYIIFLIHFMSQFNAFYIIHIL